jgi:peptidyl-prolyl cis-trans isomerase C
MRRLFFLFLLLFTLAGCRAQTVTPIVTGGESATPAPAGASDTPAAPAETPTATPTPVPAALRVNGEEVPLSEYAASLAQLEQARPDLDPAARRDQVIADLTDQTLLAQAASQSGFSLDDAALQARVDALAGQMGGAEALEAWQAQMGYTGESFRGALRRAAAAAWMRDQILAAVPVEAEQVRARQIVTRTEEGAQTVLQQANAAGTNFAALAAGYDLATRGDLYWFPRGYLNEPAVEEAAFALQPGEISGIIKSGIGYHILQVVSKEVRPLSADARLVLQRKALAAWLAEHRQSAQVDVIVP